ISKGIYYGSDQWMWGRDFLSKDTELKGQLELYKHWYHWMLWGRLGYDPTVTNDRFVGLLADRFPEVDAQQLFDAWHHASMVYPVTTGFHWGRLDFQWYIEGCKSRPAQAENETGFHDVNRFITLGTHPKSGYQSIPDFIKAQKEGTNTALKSPLAVAAELHQHADLALRLSDQLLKNKTDNKELQHSLLDIRSIGLLGKYYAHKIEGATHLALFRDTAQPEAQDQSVKALTDALNYWQQYASESGQRYKNPIWTNRVGHVDWQKTTQWVQQDIDIAREAL
ncbi:MAG: carbohydrate-binding family 6 protein, partial [Bacteroidota bacterium]